MASEIEPTDTHPDDNGIDAPKGEEYRGSPEIICPISGYRVVPRRPGQRMITTEEIKKLLEDFP